MMGHMLEGTVPASDHHQDNNILSVMKAMTEWNGNLYTNGFSINAMPSCYRHHVAYCKTEIICGKTNLLCFILTHVN